MMEARQLCIPQVKICTRPFVPTSHKFNRLTKVLNTLNYNYLTTNVPATRTYIDSQKKMVNALLRDEGKLLMDDYWQGLIENAVSYLSSDPKKYWKRLLGLRGIPRSSVGVTDNGLPDGNIIGSDEGKGEAFRGEFSPRFGRNNENNIAQDSLDEMDRFFAANPGVYESFPTADFSRFDQGCPFSKLISPSEVYAAIHDGAVKAPGEEGITKEHLRHISKVMLVRLAHIFSAFLALGMFPDSMKCALMVFIHKPGKCKCSAANYRPICLLPVLGKIYDKILTNRFTLFMEEKGLNHPHQYGFTRGRGTTSALAMCYE